MPQKESLLRLSRRGVLSSFAGTGVAAIFGGVASDYTATNVAATNQIDDIVLGSFESTLDKWQSDDEVSLSRVTRHDRPLAVSEGEYALDVTSDSTSTPTISRPITELNLATHPYFVADVVPSQIDGTNAPIDFRFRLYRPKNVLDGWSTQELVVESEPVTVPQAVPGRIYWDASDIKPELLEMGSHLEIGWYPTDRDPDSPDGAFEYRGGVVFDAIHATASVDPVGSARLSTMMRDLQFDHGTYVRTEVEDEFDTGETGTFVFDDGTAVPYRFEALAAERFLLTVAETEIKFGGGWD
ncbi:hypothetical protein [Haloarcula nitratireducens]|uniref:Uncharacterized protein n=1 Tax=Haloarcula nitratireducens TaxID=2487749 RepID=A0AAW4PLJ7_9EURY|nr:hypothetical protein [Halomicroarcula nitratireducens]MBX0298240.1 hypothetical protein [Halomicroarcula nitratireducens]